MPNLIKLNYFKPLLVFIYIWWGFFSWPPVVFAISPTTIPTLNLTPTPGVVISPTSLPSLTLMPTTSENIQIFLSELLAKPSSGEEWIELYNPNLNPINLTGWQLWDKLASPSLIYNFSADQILPQNYLVVPINRKLNDAEDGVSLKNAQGLTIDETSYTNSPTDLSWSRFEFSSAVASWSFQISSPGVVNQTPASTIAPTVTPAPTVTLAITISPAISATLIISVTRIPALFQNPVITKTIKTKFSNPVQKSFSVAHLNFKPTLKPTPLLYLSASATSDSLINLNSLTTPQMVNQKISASLASDAIIFGWWLINLIGGPSLIFSLQSTKPKHDQIVNNL